MKIYDIETLKEMFYVAVFDTDDNTWTEFEISRWKNDLYAFVKYCEEDEGSYWVGYNNLGFDSQVVEWILVNYEKWWNLSNLEICAMISQKATDVIHDRNYNVFPEWSEQQLSLKQIDLFRIHHFDNKNRMVSLKRLEFEMDFENIEEMPIHHLKENLTEDDRIQIINYCKNDVRATTDFYYITVGKTDHPLYTDNDRIQLRKDIEEEFGIYCLNYSDSKIGDEMIKKYYCEEKKIEYSQLPKKGFFRKSIAVKNCIAPYVTFKTPQLQKFLEKIKRISLKMQDDFVEQIDFYDNRYVFAKGGLHSVNKPRVFESDDEYYIIDWDVSSYYPAVIINNERWPAHLGREFLRGYEKMFNKRLELKPQSKTDKRVKGIVEALKLAVNSVYGKSGDMQNWMFDKQLTMFTCITGELSLMMLIEAYEMKGINIISANTDGVTIKIHKDLLKEMTEINDWWSTLTGYTLERADYKKIIFSTVNDYIAIKPDGEIKKKGDFLTDFELHKNKSARVVNLALEQYYVNNVPVEETITNHKNIYDFCLRQKATSNFHYEGVTKEKTTVYDKLIRYYVSNKGEKIYKIKNEICDTNAAKVSQVEAGEWLCTVCNYLPSNIKVANCDVNFKYYIDKAERMIVKIKTEGKSNRQITIPNQINLF